MAVAVVNEMKNLNTLGMVDPDAVHDDPLLAALLFLAKVHGRATSGQTLISGLPLKDQRLTPDLFARASNRIGLSSRVVKRSTDQIHALLLPCVLLTKTGEAWILTQVSDDGYSVVQPETGEGEVMLSDTQLSSVYSGYAIFVKRQYEFKQPESSRIPLKGVHWFWDTLSLSIPIYRDVLLASLVINVLALASPLFVMNVYDRVVPNQAFETLWVLALGMAMVVAFDFGIRMLRAWFIDLAGKKSDILLSAQLYEKVINLKLEHRPKSVGSFVNNLKEFESVRNFITSSSMTVLVDIPFAILFLVVITWVGGWLVAVLIGAIVALICWAWFIQRPMFQAMEKTFSASAEKSGALVESLSHLETIKALRAEGTMQSKWEELVGYIAHWGVKTRMWSSAASSASSMIQQVTTVGLIVSGTYMIAEYDLSMGALIAAVMLSSRVLMPISQLAGLLIQWQQSALALTTLNQIMSMPSEQSAERAPVSRGVLKGRMEFRTVGFSYPEQSVKALNGISFTITPGEKIGIIGPMGSGKSTLERLLLGLYQPGSGQVLIDGIDLQQMDAHDIRRCIGYVPQDVELFAGSIKENILMSAPYAGDDVLLRVSEQAGVLDFVKRHPMGFAMPVGENGRALSGGQRQCIAIARSLVHNPPILLLDEPTNSMDSRAEQILKTQLELVSKDKTLVVITHKAALLELVERVIVMNDGQIVADGPKDHILKALSQGRIRGGEQL